MVMLNVTVLIMGNKGLILTILLSGNFANDFIGEKKKIKAKKTRNALCYIFSKMLN